MPSSPSSLIARLSYFVTAILLLAGLALSQTRPRYWSTYLGGSGVDACESVIIAANGDLIVSGRTASPGLKASAQAYQVKHAGQDDGFVARLSGDGKTLLALTFLGGRSKDVATYLHEAKDGSIWVGGTTVSSNFPTTANAWSKVVRPGNDAFLVQLDAKLTRMLYGTVFTSPGHVFGNAFHIDEKRNLLYIAGVCWGQIPTTTGALRAKFANRDGYLAVLDRSVSTKTTLHYGTHVGGSGQEMTLDGMSVDAQGIVTLTGTTQSTDLPVSTGALQTKRLGTQSGFVLQIDPRLVGSKGLVHGSYLGGSGSEVGMSHVRDGQGRIHVLLTSASSDLPTTKNKLMGRGSNNDCYYAEMDTTKTGAAVLVFGSWIVAGNYSEGASWGRPSLAIHPKGVAFFVSTGSAWWTLPTASGAFQRGLNGSPRGYLALVDTKTRTAPFIAYSTEYGGLASAFCAPTALVVHGSGDLLLAGEAGPGLPNQPPVHQGKLGGGNLDGFVTRIEPRDWGSRFQSLGSACKGSAGTPKLTGIAASLGWRDGKRGSLTVEASGMATGKVCGHMLGSHKSWLSIPLPIKIGTTGCTLQASPILIFGAYTGGGGKNRLQIPLPPDRSLYGAQIALQTFVIDPGANSAKLGFTNGVLAELGW